LEFLEYLGITRSRLRFQEMQHSRCSWWTILSALSKIWVLAIHLGVKGYRLVLNLRLRRDKLILRRCGENLSTTVKKWNYLNTWVCVKVWYILICVNILIFVRDVFNRKNEVKITLNWLAITRIYKENIYFLFVLLCLLFNDF
jgi:hypothetical protein